MSTLTLELPPGVDPDRLRLHVALQLFQEGGASSGHAAAIAGIPQRAFLEELSQRKIPIAGYGPGELAAELRTWESK